MTEETFLALRIGLLEKRFQEIDIHLNEAKGKTYNPQIYGAFCRSAHILLVAHFEGVIKDIAKDVLDDISGKCGFKNAPNIIKRTFCEHFMGRNNNGEFDEKIKNRLLDTFDGVEIDFKVDPFLFENNKNPSPHMLQNILTKFGVQNFIWNLKGSDLDVVFEDSKSDVQVLKDKLKAHIIQGVKTFPYQLSESIYSPDLRLKNKPGKKTLWESFLDELLVHRHSIVHGNTLENPTNHNEIEKAKIKIEILLYAFIIAIGNAASPQIATSSKIIFN